MLSWRLYYLSLFDFETTPQVDVIDPAGIVESMALQDAGRTIRICLNASASERTLSSRFLDEFFGAGVQHIAFATDDIFAAAAAMPGGGARAAADPGQLLRRPRGAAGARAGAGRPAARERHPLRRGRGRALLPALHPRLPRAVLLRDRRARRLRRLRRRRTRRSGWPRRRGWRAGRRCRGHERSRTYAGSAASGSTADAGRARRPAGGLRQLARHRLPRLGPRCCRSCPPACGSSATTCAATA